MTCITRLSSFLAVCVGVLTAPLGLLAMSGAYAQTPVSWDVSEESTLDFTFTQSQAEVQGTFSDFESDIRFSPDALGESRVEVRVNLASIETGSSERDQTAKGETFFDVEDHPTAVFVADSFTQIEAGRYTADGSLQIRGMEKPLTLPFTLEISGESGNQTARAEGEVEINRLNYNLGEGDFEDDSFLSHIVTVHFVIIASEATAE